MEEQFILRVPPSIAERLDRLLSENENASSSEDKSLDLSFSGENVLSLIKLAFYNNLRDVLESKIWLIWIQNFKKKKNGEAKICIDLMTIDNI